MITLQERVHGSKRPDWPLSKLHRLFTIRKGFKNSGMIEDNLLSLSYGRIIQKNIDTSEGLLPESFETYQIVESGNIVMRLTDLQNDKRSLRQGLVTQRGIITSAYDALEVKEPYDPRFWAYALLALDLAKYYYSLGGGVRQSIKFADFPNDWISAPLPETQRAIADFLDRETARIDQLIEKKQRLVELLEERKYSAVEQAITAKDKATKLGYHVDILPGYAFASGQFTTDPKDMRLLRGANVSPSKVRWDDVVYWPIADTQTAKKYLLSPGDIVLGMDRPWISSGIRVAELTEDDCPSLLLQRVCKVTPRQTLEKEYLKLLLRSRRFLGYFEPILTGVSVPHISEAQICNFRFSYPSKMEQKRRSDACIKRLKECDQLAARVSVSFDRLREFRSAIITAAVTGQINVDEWSRRGGTDAKLDAIAKEMEERA